MEVKSDKNILTILKVLKDAPKPLSGIKIAQKLNSNGFQLNPRTVRYYLMLSDRAGYTKKINNYHGRIITPAGIRELHDAFIIKKIGLIISKIEALSYNMTFSLASLNGTIVLNVSTLNIKDFDKAKDFMLPVFRKGFGIGHFCAYGSPDGYIGDYHVPSDKIAIGTICNVTINGIFLKEGIPVYSRFGGLLEIKDGKPVKFKEIIEYRSSTIDPLEIFIKGNMTSVAKAVKTGNGVIGVSLREIPEAAIAKAIILKRKLEHIGLGGILFIGNSHHELLDITLPRGRAAMIVMGGLNPFAACQEEGIETHNMAMKTLYDFNGLSRFD